MEIWPFISKTWPWLIFMAHFWRPLLENNDFNVLDYGAFGDGVSDDYQAFSQAWKAACHVSGAKIVVPTGKTFLLSAVSFRGPCSAGFSFQIDGTILAPSNPSSWNQSKTWILFRSLKYFTLTGRGTLDGQGYEWWNQSCKRNPENPCKKAPTVLKFISCVDLRIQKVSIQNSQQMHMEIYGCSDVQVSNVKITSPGSSPNTDGIHISHSHDVLVKNAHIRCGDDCISIVAGCANIQMSNIKCGPGHGISIGSLGKHGSEAYVNNIHLQSATIAGTSNGVRIKTWIGGSGNATGIFFGDIVMHKVARPIVINQHYYDPALRDKSNITAVSISNVVYSNIVGTSSTHKAILLECSDVIPCTGIVLQNVTLTDVKHKPVISVCENLEVSYSDPVDPKCPNSSLITHIKQRRSHRK